MLRTVFREVSRKCMQIQTACTYTVALSGSLTQTDKPKRSHQHHHTVYTLEDRDTPKYPQNDTKAQMMTVSQVSARPLTNTRTLHVSSSSYIYALRFSHARTCSAAVSSHMFVTHRKSHQTRTSSPNTRARREGCLTSNTGNVWVSAFICVCVRV